MKVQNSLVRNYSNPNPTPPEKQEPQKPAEPRDNYQPRSYLEAVKTGLIGAAIVGIPAAMGAGKSALFGKEVGIVSGLVTGPAFGAAVGAVGGYKLTPGKEQGGILLCFLTVPLGATIGAFGYPLLSTIGSAGGWTGAAIGAAIGGVGLGAAEAYFVHKDNSQHKH